MLALSSLVWLWAQLANAHEVLPTIADLEVANGQAQLSLRMNAEAFVAGLNLDEITDTDEVTGGNDYDALRALSVADFEARLRAALPDVLKGVTLRAGELSAVWEVVEVRVAPLADLELPRATVVALRTDVPSGTQQVTLVWPEGHGALVLRQVGVEDPYTGFLNGGETSPPISVMGGDALSGWQSFLAYVPVGFDHILPKGLDHILFVLGLFFLSLHLRPLIWQISAFTLAHTVTLAAGALGWVNVPSAIVEPLIAASISFVAIENILSRGLSPWRPVVVFGFGLLHGLGFASVLEEFGLPEDTFIPALLGFNVGVELGQLTVIALAFCAVGFWFGKKPWYRARIAVPASAVIALIGAWWFVERVFF
ncbi:HupE/UreJ family protein [Shimia aestuarii]|uniref:HupE / UreJ protein n=1 Tax=Shimia aestuarii TaxID=254406 RepID=A0A1I4P635_9RHOB|nr:HupE / UreJ protein [Shimia aestuarii]